MAGKPGDGVTPPNLPRNSLFVEASATEDNSVAYVTMNKMAELKMDSGDYVHIISQHQRRCVFVIVADNSTDVSSVRISKYGRANLQVRVGEIVRLEIFPGIKKAIRVHVLPMQDTLTDIPWNLHDQFLRPYFHQAYRPLTHGDLFHVRGAMTSVDFKVTSIEPSPASFLASSTLICCQGQALPRQTEDEYVQHAVYEDFGISDAQMEALRRLFDIPLRFPHVYKAAQLSAPKGALLVGPPGTGKTMRAEALANEHRESLILVDCALILASATEEPLAALREAFARIQLTAHSIVFIKNLDMLFMQDTTFNYPSSLVTSLLHELQQKKAIVLASSKSRDKIDSQLKSSVFDLELIIDLPNTANRAYLLGKFCKNYVLARDVDLRKISGDTRGWSGASLMKLCQKAAEVAIREDLRFVESGDGATISKVMGKALITSAAFEVALMEMPGKTWKLPVKNFNWTKVGVDDVLRNQLEDKVVNPLSHRVRYAKLHVDRPKGALLFGSPGTGKTSLAHTLAQHCGAELIVVKGPEWLAARGVGGAEKSVQMVFEKARAAQPCIVFLDEIDSVGTARRNTAAESGVLDRVLNQLLTEMDAIQPDSATFVLAATNRPQTLDKALLRRLEGLIYVQLPNEECRAAIFEENFKLTKLAPDVDLKDCATRTTGYCAADIAGICKAAAGASVRDWIKKNPKSEDIEMVDDASSQIPDISKDNIEEALKSSRRTVTDADVKAYDAIAETLLSGRASDSGDADCSYIS